MRHLLEHSPINGKIIVLQPRRVVVRALATYIATSLGEHVGDRVGYQIRGETKHSKSTQLLFVTEAILARRLMTDPELADVGLIVFDEFHERNVHSDFGLALALEVQQILREDLRLLVMSATLALPELESMLGDSAVIEVPGRQFPIDYHYRPMATTRLDIEHVARVVAEAMRSHEGDVLVFLPGQGEIHRCVEQLLIQQKRGTVPDCGVYALYGSQSQKEQQRALVPDENGARKIIVATNVAETSLTIEGIRIVVDSGLERNMMLELSTGIERLTLRQISKASATQRAGRAGRTAAGVCYRLWSAETQQRLISQSDPDILQRDVSDLVLAAQAWGTPLTELDLLTQPRKVQLDTAYKKLQSLGALDANMVITPHGRDVLQMPLDIRLAHMFLITDARWPGAEERLTAAAWVAAHLGDNGRSSSDNLEENIRFKIHQSYKRFWSDVTRFLHNSNGVQQPVPSNLISVELLAQSVSLAYPDWVARRQTAEGYKLANGKRVTLNSNSPLGKHPWLAIARMFTTQGGDIKVAEAIPIEESQVLQLFESDIVEQQEWQWVQSNQRFQARSVRRLGQIILSEQSLSNQAISLSQQQRNAAWQSLIGKKGLDWLPLSEGAQQLILRGQHAYAFCKRSDIEPFPEFSQQYLLESLHQWCLPYLTNCSSLEDLRALDWHAMLKSLLNWQQQQWLDEQLPTRFELPVGQSVGLDYAAINWQELSKTPKPKVSAPMQWFFGFSQTPTIADGHVALQCELLSPAKRPLQMTADLGAFWFSDTYQSIKKEMKGRYPKHLWPDDPANTEATKLTKRHLNKS